MFANPIWSALLLAVPFVVYFTIIRPRLKAKLTNLYSHIDSFWAWLWRVTYAFRTFVIASLAAIITALPDLLVLIPGIDLSFLPQPWPGYVSAAATGLIAIMKAFETRPKGEKA